MNKTRFNPRCYSGTELSGGDGDGDDDDLNEVQLDDGDDGDDLLSLERNFLGILLPTGELFSLSSFRPVDIGEAPHFSTLKRLLSVVGVELARS